jgi:hypothetical protein
MMIFSAIPLVMAFLAGLALLAYSFITRSRRLRRFSVIFMLMSAGIAAVFIIAGTIMEPEWNPKIGNDQEVVGVWTKGQERLELIADGHFVYGIPPTAKIGSWARDDWNLYLKPGVFKPGEPSNVMRFIQFHGHYRILTHPPDEPDSWNHDYGLSKNE